MKKLAKKTALVLLTATLLIGALHQWFWFNWHVMSRVGAVVDTYESGDNRTDRD